MLTEKERLVLENIKQGKILNAGCGYGKISKLLNDRGLEVVNFDIDVERLKQAKKLTTNLIRADAHMMPFKDGVFDCVIATALIEHLKSPETFLEECVRVLKNDGRLLIETPNKILYNLLIKIGKANYDPTHINEMGYFRLKNILKKHFDEVVILAQDYPFKGRIVRYDPKLRELDRFLTFTAFIFFCICDKPKKEDKE